MSIDKVSAQVCTCSSHLRFPGHPTVGAWTSVPRLYKDKVESRQEEDSNLYLLTHAQTDELPKSLQCNRVWILSLLLPDIPVSVTGGLIGGPKVKNATLCGGMPEGNHNYGRIYDP